MAGEFCVRKPDTIFFACRICEKNLEAPKMQIGNRVYCEECDRPTVVPGQSTRVPSIQKKTPKDEVEDIPFVLAVEPEEVVPVEFTIPKVGGGIKTRVTQKTADSMASTFLGGMLVAIGAILMVMLGGKPGKA